MCNGFFSWGNSAFWGNGFSEILGEIVLGEIFRFDILGEIDKGKF